MFNFMLLLLCFFICGRFFFVLVLRVKGQRNLNFIFGIFIRTCNVSSNFATSEMKIYPCVYIKEIILRLNLVKKK